MRQEVTFARESSTNLPKIDTLFKVMMSLPGKKRRLKTAEEFGSSLMVYLGKKVERTTMDYKVFKESLRNL